MSKVFQVLTQNGVSRPLSRLVKHYSTVCFFLFFTHTLDYGFLPFVLPFSLHSRSPPPTPTRYSLYTYYFSLFSTDFSTIFLSHFLLLFFPSSSLHTLIPFSAVTKQPWLLSYGFNMCMYIFPFFPWFFLCNFILYFSLK